MQELTFKYEPKDYSYYSKETLGIKRIFLYTLKTLAVPYCIIAIIMALAFTSAMYGGISLYIPFILTFIIAFIVSLLLLICFGLLRLTIFNNGKHILRLQQGIPQETTIKIDDETIFCYAGTDKTIQTTYKWNSIKDVHNTKHLLIIFVSDLHGLIIPKRIFNSEKEIDNCWKLLQDCYNNAQKSE